MRSGLRLADPRAHRARALSVCVGLLAVSLAGGAAAAAGPPSWVETDGPPWGASPADEEDSDPPPLKVCRPPTPELPCSVGG